MKAPYIIFEGNDGSGKSTTMKAVAHELSERFKSFNPILTQHPGSTPLGRHLRQLVKFPAKIDPAIVMDDLSRQMLYMVDTVSFIKTLLQPNLDAGTPVFADRSSFISALVYGVADGLTLSDIARLVEVIMPPKADRLYILQCPCDVGKSRIAAGRNELDHYDKKPSEFAQKIEKIYASLVTSSAQQTMLVSRAVSIDDVIYIDANRPLDAVVSEIVSDATSMIKDRYSFIPQ